MQPISNTFGLVWKVVQSAAEWFDWLVMIVGTAGATYWGITTVTAIVAMTSASPMVLLIAPVAVAVFFAVAPRLFKMLASLADPGEHPARLLGYLRGYLKSVFENVAKIIYIAHIALLSVCGIGGATAFMISLLPLGIASALFLAPLCMALVGLGIFSVKIEGWLKSNSTDVHDLEQNVFGFKSILRIFGSAAGLTWLLDASAINSLVMALTGGISLAALLGAAAPALILIVCLGFGAHSVYKNLWVEWNHPNHVLNKMVLAPLLARFYRAIMYVDGVITNSLIKDAVTSPLWVPYKIGMWLRDVVTGVEQQDRQHDSLFTHFRRAGKAVECFNQGPVSWMWTGETANDLDSGDESYSEVMLKPPPTR